MKHDEGLRELKRHGGGGQWAQIVALSKCRRASHLFFLNNEEFERATYMEVRCTRKLHLGLCQT